MVPIHRRMFLALALLGLCSTSPLWARRPDTGFLNRTVVVNGVTYKYQVFVPDNWNKNVKWPVILFLHGSGERGTDGIIPTEIGIGTAIRKHVDRFPFIVVFPQCREHDWWTSVAMEAQVLKALDQSIKEFKGDPQRIYLTGLSMGGYGTWGIAASHPGKFAAIVPVCGGIRLPHGLKTPTAPPMDDSADPYAATAQKIGKTPVWIFHGDADNRVSVSEARQMNDALKAAGGDVRYTEYPGVTHNSWDNAYGEAALYPWLLALKLSPSK